MLPYEPDFTFIPMYRPMVDCVIYMISLSLSSSLSSIMLRKPLSRRLIEPYCQHKAYHAVVYGSLVRGQFQNPANAQCPTFMTAMGGWHLFLTFPYQIARTRALTDVIMSRYIVPKLPSNRALCHGCQDIIGATHPRGVVQLHFPY
jgi:hypothetical protein